ncbi:hypothetical protein RHSIM_Rhsim03G0113800 [Rhododendron simsii]|uniref:Nodulin-like domain-containing protein n=1 Tax=Rhododendron simsii TaxID=118357 RepID=A0A834LUP1_RHOSS|nr:hypothetical protein RHSIM_Rhsim03G0113800 [Rhododendron simsii]
MAFSGCGGSGCANTNSLALQVLTGRWFMVFASFLIMSAAGATYMFGDYSGEIKSALGYDQTTITLLSFFKDLGANVGVLSGLINEVTPPWVVLSMGAVLNFFGYVIWTFWILGLCFHLFSLKSLDDPLAEWLQEEEHAILDDVDNSEWLDTGDTQNPQNVDLSEHSSSGGRGLSPSGSGGEDDDGPNGWETQDNIVNRTTYHEEDGGIRDSTQQ